MVQILPYKKIEARFVPWSPVFLQVAEQLINSITTHDFEVIHFGSTSFGAGGKGIIDVSVLYKNNDLAQAVQHLHALGFQKQVSDKPFPPQRPRLDGAILFNNQTYYIHAHVIQHDSEEHHKQLHYKQLMLNNPELRMQYEATKKQILAKGITEQEAYGDEKSIFVKQYL